jgi:lysyl endopeptidase
VKKRILIATIFILTLLSANAQMPTMRSAHAKGIHYKRVFDNPVLKMPAFNLKGMLHEDSIDNVSKVGGMRFAKKFYVNLSPDNSGQIYMGDDGSKIWKVDITSVGAYSINLLFTEFELPEGAELYIYNKKQTQVIGPLTSKDNAASGVLPTAPIDGDSITVEYREPANVAAPAKLRIGEVNHDYRGLKTLPQANNSSYLKDTCSLYTTCVSEVSEIKQSVCLLIIAGDGYCSGTLINNTANNGKPYILTAAHCFEDHVNYTEVSVDFSVANTKSKETVVFFNYEVPNCNSTIRGSEEFTIGGATLKAYSTDIDFALLELNVKPPEDFRPYYAGWDRTTTPSAPVRGIHHPYGTVKRVAVANNVPMRFFDSFDNTMLFDSHWQIAQWNVGVTYAGSSGSGLFDSNLRLIGGLSGGASICSDPVNDFYFRINKAWNYYSDPSKQLKVWLDPNNSNVMSVNGYNPYGDTAAVRLTNMAASEAVEKAYLSSPKSGLLAGQNSLAMTEYAEKYTVTDNPKIYGVYLMPALAKKYYYSSNNIMVKIYAGETFPDVLLATKDISLSTLEWNNYFYSNAKVIPYTNKENFIRFSTPVKAGKTFFVSYQVPYNNLPTDSFALYTAQTRGNSGSNTAYVKKNGAWSPLTDYSTVHTSLWVDPVLSYRLYDNLDPDNDGVPDYLDQCPNTPSGVTVDAKGCPIDTDNDGVPDYLDLCPNTRSGVTVDEHGCYKEVYVYPTLTSKNVNLFFKDYDSGTCDVKLYGSVGKLLYSTSLSYIKDSPVSLPLNPMLGGVYYLQITSAGQTSVKKIIVVGN